MPPSTDRDPVQGFSPAGQLLTLITGYWPAQALHVVAELGVADHLGRTPMPLEELAAKVGAHAPSLGRVMGALASIGVFAEPEPQRFAITPMSALLKSGLPGNLRDFARMQGARWHWDAWGDALAAVRTGRPAIETRSGAIDCFAHLANHPAARAVFDAAMAGYADQAHAAALDVVSLGDAVCIVDVGGGQGALLAAWLDALPGARGVLVDRAEVVAEATPLFARYGVADRATIVAGDFFTELPAGGDVYVLSSVIHDWDDADAVRILANVVRAMPVDARVLLLENVLPDDGSAHPARFVDLEMLMVARGRERTASEYRALLDRAGLRCVQVLPTATSISVVEAVRA